MSASAWIIETPFFLILNILMNNTHMQAHIQNGYGFEVQISIFYACDTFGCVKLRACGNFFLVFLLFVEQFLIRHEKRDITVNKLYVVLASWRPQDRILNFHNSNRATWIQANIRLTIIFTIFGETFIQLRRQIMELQRVVEVFFSEKKS